MSHTPLRHSTHPLNFSSRTPLKPIRTILSSLLLVAFAGSAFAQAPTTLANDKAQLKSDETALTAAKQKLDADKITLKDNTKSGRTTAESPDAKQVRLDKRSVDGMKKNIAAGEPGPQMTSDKAALKKSKKKLRTSKKKLKT
ncbi:hypothetical protein, partial [Lacisediminimonas sp.]|uniref:hypothetical protein n=1 Tax=Lacisediminimonas sp. TaxID=3060582 RepID=UPI00271DDC61